MDPLSAEEKRTLVLNLLVSMNFSYQTDVKSFVFNDPKHNVLLFDRVGVYRRVVHAAVKQYFACGDGVGFRIPLLEADGDKTTQLIHLNPAKFEKAFELEQA